MDKRICPRCAKSIPPWQPVHLPCLLYRLRFVLGFVLVILLLVFSPMLVRSIDWINTKAHTSHNNESVLPAQLTPTSFALPTRISEPTIIITSTKISRPIVTLTPTKTSEPTATITPEPSLTPLTALPERPDDFIRFYYQAINDRRYELTFSLLSRGFKDRNHCCNVDGSYQIEPYIEWWNTIESVDIISTDVINSDNNTAQVSVTLCYYTKKGATDIDQYWYFLILDEIRNAWLIDIVELR